VKIDFFVPDAANRYADLQSVAPFIRFSQTSGSPRVIINDRKYSLWVLERASRLPSGLGRAVPLDAIGVVIGKNIPANERQMLESDGLSWIDLRGAIHLEKDQLFVHIDRPSEISPTKNKMLRLPQHRLGPVSIRIAQVLAASPIEMAWNTKELAIKARASVGQTHNVLSTLEEERLVINTLSGRIVVNKEALLDWLLANEFRQRKPERIQTYLYSKNEMDLARRFDEVLSRQSDDLTKYAITSTLGAKLWDAPVTTTTITRVRISNVLITEILSLMDLPILDPLDRGNGANLELWHDTGQVGTVHSSEINGVKVAPMVRVWLDLMRQGERYAEGANLLKGKILGR